MKFHKERTGIRFHLEGVEAYRMAFRDSTLQRVLVQQLLGEAQSGVWKRINVAEMAFRDDRDREPLDITGFVLEPRATIVDELTRHSHTAQCFLPVSSLIVTVVARSLAEDPNRPDPGGIGFVTVVPGQAIIVEKGTWHTLPFVFGPSVSCVSIMRRATLDAYHDVRDLGAEGWIGELEWKD